VRSYNSDALSRRPPHPTINSRPGSRLRRCLILLASAACLLPPPPASARPPQLRLERALGAGSPAGAAEGAAFVRADRIAGEIEETITLEGNAEVRRGGTVLRGDRITFSVARDEVEAVGNVRVFRDGIAVFGPSLSLRIDARTGAMPDAGFTYAPHGGRGTASLIEFLDGDRLRVEDAVYTTCAPGDDSWWISARRLTIDRVAEVGYAEGALVNFQGLPILASPYFQFPLGDRRRSGLLTPSLGINNKLGIEATVPYYWDIAPNRDATISPRVMSKRGLLIGTEFRYLEPEHAGIVEYDIVPRDSVSGEARSYLAVRHQYDNGSGFTGGVDFNRVSDDFVLSDYARTIAGASRVVLPQMAFLQVTRPLWSTLLRVEMNQTLQNPTEPVIPPHERVPQLAVSAAAPPIGGFDAAVALDASRFDHPTLRTGWRVLASPTLAYPLRAPGWFIVPRAQWHAAWYDLDNPRPGFDKQPTLGVPTATVDGGLVFEREADWFGQSMLQTLEPRLFYAYAPFRDQSQLPVFDSAVADFNFTQLFRPNRFSGNDRVSEANQLTTALVGRVIDPATGIERLRGAVGQRFYFSSDRVTLAPGTERDSSESDLLVELRGAITRDWITDLYVQHSTAENKLVRAAASLRWQPRPGSVLGIGYRYKIDEIEQVSLATQWPIAARWYGVGLANYSIRDRRWVELLGGLEYRDDCWAARFVAQSFVTIGQAPTSSFMFQLQLNGVASIGTGLLDQLRRSIPGYQVLDPRMTGIGRYEDYE
jgi:LPS-assembly protein